MMLIRFLCIFVWVTWMWNQQGLASTESNSTMTFKTIIDNLLDNGSYDPTIRPLSDVGQALQVEVDVVLNTLGPVSEREMQMTASFYLRQQWRDPRLAFDGMNQTILLNYRRVNSIWLPDLFFSQSKYEYSHVVTVPNLLIRLHPDGTILFSQRLTVTFQCLMNLRKFPLDEQICYIRMESYSHTTDDMYLVWSSARKSMDILENAHIPDFRLTEISTHDCTATYATGTFPCLEARLFLQRQIGFYMTQTYVPCVLIVSLSWVSFWLDTHAIPARISVGLLTVLTITTQSSAVRSELPRVPYTKSIDVWMSVCLIFVFAAYMQYGFVTVFSRRHRKCQGSSVSHDSCVAHKRASSIETIVSVNGEPVTSRQTSFHNANARQSSSTSARLHRRSSVFQFDHESRDLGRVVDKWSRIVFPLSFVLFNVAYWLYYTL